MKTVQLIFRYDKPSFIGKLIQWWTKTNRSRKDTAYHVEIGFDSIFYSADSKELVWRAKARFNFTGWRVYNILVTDEEYDTMLAKAESFIDIDYDWLNIFGSDIFGLGYQDSKKLTCDEGTGRILVLCEFGGNLKDIAMLNPNTLEEYVNGQTEID